MAISDSEIIANVTEADRLLQQRILQLSGKLEKTKDESGSTVDDLKHLLQYASPHHVQRPAVLKKHGLEIGHGFSLHGELVLSSRATAIGGPRLNSWWLNDKERAFRFIDRLGGVRRPSSSGTTLPLDEISFDGNSVLKAAHGSGSRGCYLPLVGERWRYVKTGETLSGEEEVRKHATALMDPKLNSVPLKDEWKTEEMIVEDRENKTPARDVKFYTFYGEIAFGFEIVRYPEAQYHYFDSETNETIHPLKISTPTFKGSGASEEEIRLIKRISKEIPAPFVSVDMLRSHDGLVFCEFTPHPGFVVNFQPEWDRALGGMWRLAQGRLMEDLLGGKSFSAFQETTSGRLSV